MISSRLDLPHTLMGKTTIWFLIFSIVISASYSTGISDDNDIPISTPAAANPVSVPTPAAANPVSVPTPAVIPSANQPSTLANPVSTSTTSFSPPVASATVGNVGPHDYSLFFFMHDILGGSIPSARAVTGIVTNPAVNGQVPFAKPNGAVLPINNGIPQNSNNNGILNNNNIPFLPGLSGNGVNVIQNNGNNNNNFFNGIQNPAGTNLQQLLFGTLTAFDDELTESHDLGSGVIGKAQGFYVGSSVDGKSQTMAFTAMFESGGYEDSISFFGVHRISVSESHLGIMGGTGKYVNAEGYAIVKTLPSVINQHNTDGVETVLQFTVYLAH